MINKESQVILSYVNDHDKGLVDLVNYILGKGRC
ncbi:hypothetical protein T259_3308 [Clostridium botulinum CDC_1436]|nr:hypothetical protein T259_3308 [Clostridium botulinum CDC_1436]